jgi:hypothetical protein
MGTVDITWHTGTLRWYAQDNAEIPGRYDFNTTINREGYAGHIAHFQGAESVPREMLRDSHLLAEKGFDWVTYERYWRDEQTGRLRRKVVWLRLVPKPRPRYDPEED